MSVHDNLIEYADPALYDDENASFEPDGVFFRDLINWSCSPSIDICQAFTYGRVDLLAIAHRIPFNDQVIDREFLLASPQPIRREAMKGVEVMLCNRHLAAPWWIVDTQLA